MVCVGKDSIDQAIWEIEDGLAKTESTKLAEHMIAPLKWYVFSGRASSLFLQKLLNKTDQQKEKIITILRKYYGNYEDAVDRICRVLKYERLKL